MPLYVYLCRSCETRFERIRSFAERLEPWTCPECAAEVQFALSLSTPGFVGTASGEMACRSDGPGPGAACCGGGACGLN